MELIFAGKILIIIFIIFLVRMAIDGPFIFSTGNKHVIEIVDFKFNKNHLKIKKGDKVSFVNKDQIRYTITNEHPLIPNSKILYKRDKFEHIFNHDFGKVEFNTSLYKGVEPIIIEQEKTFVKKPYFKQLLNIFKSLFI